MDVSDKINLDVFLQDLGGCGPFQWFVEAILCIGSIPAFMSLQFMVFGIYNPGWACLNDTLDFYNATSNETDTVSYVYGNIDDKRTDNETDSCADFKACQRVEFNPIASTIVTEWGLLCEKAWIPSLIISMLMVGTITGLLFSGYVGDKFGRKLTYFVALAIQSVINIVSIYSTSWQMFVATEFLLGVCIAFVSVGGLLSAEFVIPKWRIRVASIPTWIAGVLLYSVAAMLTKNWRTLRLISGVAGAASFVAAYFVPESIRWLVANGKRTRVFRTAKMIARFNRADMSKVNVGDLFARGTNDSETEDKSNKFFSLFKRGYKVPTLVIGFTFLITDLIYFALSFGISSLPGDIYENMIIMSLSEIPSCAICFALGNKWGRRVFALVTTITLSACLFGVTVIDAFAEGATHKFGTLAMVIVCKVVLNIPWYITSTITIELYPTVVRSTVTAYARMFSFIGGTIAPLIIPGYSESFYICYLVMGIASFLVALLILLLPETKGKTLANTWKEEEERAVAEQSKQQETNTVV